MIRDLKKTLLFFLTLRNSKLSLRHYYSCGTTLHPTTVSTPMSPICQCVAICRETFLPDSCRFNAFYRISTPKISLVYQINCLLRKLSDVLVPDEDALFTCTTENIRYLFVHLLYHLLKSLYIC